MRIRHDRITSPPSNELQLFVARSGRLSARIHRNGSFLHLHSAIQPEAEADHFTEMSFWGDLIVFLGMGLGYHVAPFLKNIPADRSVLLIDYYPDCIDHCRQHLSGALPIKTVMISSATKDIERILREIATSARYIQIIKHPASYHAHRDFYETALQSIGFKRVNAAEAGPPLLFSGSFFLEAELERALTADGRPPALFRYNSINDIPAFESELSLAIQRQRPRYILSVNMKGFDADGIVSDVTARHGVPVVVWFVDDPHPILLAQKKNIRNHLYAFSWERSYLPWLARQGFGTVHHLPLAGDPSLFHPSPDVAVSTELGFVGSSMGGTFRTDLAARFLWNPDLEPLVIAAAKRLLADRSTPLATLASAASRSCGIPIPFSDDRNLTWLYSYIIHTASMLRRRELIGACLMAGIETFGDPEGWKELFGSAINAHPDIDYACGLRSTYASIAINLNITSSQMATAVNQRVFDIPLCNGFVLNDAQSDLCELFAPQEIATYTSRDELLEKIAWYRSHPGERLLIASKARSAILANHTYTHRLAVVEKILH